MSSFFKEYAEYCDLIWAGGKKRDTGFYIEVARECEGPVLECGCGTGTLVVDLALAGIPVTGVDKFQEMIDVARKKVEQLNPKARSLASLGAADIAEFQTDDRFGLSVFSGNTLSCLVTQEEQTRALRNIHDLLKPTGKLLIVQLTPERWLSQIQEGWNEGKAVRVAETGVTFQLSTQSRVDRGKMEVISDFRMLIKNSSGDTETREASHTERIMSRDALLNLLGETGYRVTEEWGEYDRRPYQSGEKRIILLAERA